MKLTEEQKRKLKEVFDELHLNCEEVGGSHYDMPIPPIAFIDANDMGFTEGSIVKYVSRHEKKNGKEDLLKARTLLNRLIEQYGD